uniref:Putative basic region leucine zipper transcription factor n=1 Tax=Ixodes ricinus TaxID=34613 RepID=V5IHM0_IXORI
MGPVHLLEQPHLIWGREMPVERTLCHDDNSNSEDCPEAAIDMSLASRPSPAPPSMGSSHHSNERPRTPTPGRRARTRRTRERRKRNNESAKRSRKRAPHRKEQHGRRCAYLYLEQENLQLRTELTMLRSEVDKLRQLLFVGKHNTS